MFLQVEDNMTIDELQDRFAQCFPQLRIEFYSKPHKRFAPSDRRYQLNKSDRIGNIRQNHNKGSLEIKSWQTVAKVEKELKDVYGLNAQIFRYDDGKPVQTTLSDELTLREQSEFSSNTGLRFNSAV